MKFFWQKSNKDEILQMEKILQESLTPVAPQPEFVADLRQNLLVQFPRWYTTGVAESSEPARAGKLQTGILVASGIAGSILLVISGIRGILSLIAAITLLMNMRHNSRHSASKAA